MMTEKAIADIVNIYLEGSGRFLVNVKVTPQNKIMVFIDGDDGVTIEDCKDLSRHIERHFNRDDEDFELMVSSVGIGQPLQLHRQFVNNIGRRMEITGNDQRTHKGKLTDVTEEGIVLEKEIPEKGKKKKKEPDTNTGSGTFIPFGDIKEARVRVSFK